MHTKSIIVLVFSFWLFALIGGVVYQFAFKDDKNNSEEVQESNEDEIEAEQSDDVKDGGLEGLANSSLQQSRRNTQRKVDTERLAAAIYQYKLDNQYKIPEQASQISSLVVRPYIQEYTDPATGTEYVFTDGVLTGIGQIRYVIGYECDNGSGDIVMVTSYDEDSFTLQVQLEGGDFYCTTG